MKLKVVLLWSLCCVINGEGVSTTQSTAEYPPCNNNIIFAYENTLKLEETTYKKQVNFLTNYAFEEWTNFKGLTIYSDGNKTFKTDFKSKSDVKNYILNNKQVEKDVDACDIFSDLYYQETPDFTSFIIFLREFSTKEVYSTCNNIINDLNSGNNLILFVPLSNAINIDDLKYHFPEATILVWDIANKDTPDDWKEQFNKNFDCDRYPCDNEIFIGYETTTELVASRYKKQINFLANMLFENWTRFDKLSLLSYGNRTFKDTGFFKSKSDLTEFIESSVQVETDTTTCDTFVDVYSLSYSSNIVLFLREFNQKDVNDGCKSNIDELNIGPIAFVILSEDVIVEELQAYFPRAKIIKWDIDNKDAPDDWRNQFYDAYGCNPKTTTTYPITTTENPIDCCQCSKKVFVAYDKSTVLNGTEFKRLQNFLIDYVFQNWTSFDQLGLVSFADNKTKDELKYLENKKMLDSFIRNDKQVDKKPSLCKVFYSLVSSYANVIFVSEFTVEDITEDCRSFPKYPGNGRDFVTFVAMTDAVQTDLLNEYVPQAQIIKWNISEEETPRSWEWRFMEAYNCSKKHNQQMYPCDNRILLGYDESLTTNLLNTLKEFLINSLFNKETWTAFEDLELIAYSENMRIQDFGTMKNIEHIHNFINNGTKTNSTTSLCQVFYELASAHTLGINIILFVSEFHEHESDECPLWIEKVRNNANSITFVNLTKQVNTDYLLSIIPHVNFISWNISEEKAPTDWENQFFSSFGCENFSVESQTYPCLNKIGIVFDRSRYLTPFAYQRLTNFLLTRVFINEWTNSEYNIWLASYANHTNDIYPASLLQTKFFIHQSLKTEEESKLCETLKGFRIYSTYFIFFISKFDDEVLTSDCLGNGKGINDHSKQFTFIALTSLVNITLLQQTFQNATIVEWSIEHEPELDDWTQVLWESFGCANESSIVFPHSTSTYLLTTRHLTSTAKISTTPLVSTTQTSTTKLITSTVTTTTAPILSTKPSSSGGNSNQERAILLGIFIPLLIIVILGFIACFCLYKRRKHRQLVENMVSNKFYRENEACDEDREEDQWEIQIECLQINFLDKLGSGAFGDVYLGKINGSAPIKTIYSDSPHCQRFQNCEVAIKSLPQTQVDEYARNEFWKEIEFMKSLKAHVNLVCFLGYVYDPTSPLMLLEYCANGDLLKFIKSNKQKFVESFESQEENSDCKTLISFAWQISSGLEYLSSLDLIHRDVAARNILLDSQNVCKLSDFGLCRLAEDLTYQSKGGKLPIRWMAIESLKDYVYSQKTDVWSYGVLLWELFSLGDLPYVHIENILAFIESGKRLDEPQYCSDEVYEIMMSCWLIDPEDRPTFAAICQILSKMLETSTMHYNYVDTLALIEEANQIDDLNGEYDEIIV